jgi:hypothetical protein
MKLIKAIVITCLLFLLTSCDPIYTFYFVNQSDRRVYSFLGYNYPDTLLTTLIPGDPYGFGDTALLWQEIGVSSTVFETVDETIHKIKTVDTLSVFIIDLDTLDYYSWDTVVKYNMVLQRYDISLSDMEELEKNRHSSILFFPPTEDMKHIHMWPPYGTYDEFGRRKTYINLIYRP